MIKEEKVLKRKKVLRENPTPRIILYINEKTEQMTVVYDFCCEQDFTAFWNRVWGWIVLLGDATADVIVEVVT